MPPERGRASRACASCRKQKTRCYESDTPGKPCLRCERLHQQCSFVQTWPAAEESDLELRAASTANQVETDTR